MNARCYEDLKAAIYTRNKAQLLLTIDMITQPNTVPFHVIVIVVEGVTFQYDYSNYFDKTWQHESRLKWALNICDTYRGRQRLALFAALKFWKRIGHDMSKVITQYYDKTVKALLQ